MSDSKRILSDRANRIYMAESDLSWRQAWLQAEDELYPNIVLRRRTGYRASTWFTLLWVAVGLAFGFVPGIVSQVVLPDWMSTEPQFASAGGTVYLVLLALSGLGVVAIGLRFGLTGRATEGWAAAVRMYGGVVVGTWLSVISVASGSDAGLAAILFAIMIGMPYWVCAAAGLRLGAVVSNSRTG